MLEGGKPATPDVVKHIDRCLSCLACMTTCPSGVHYMHLVDHARAHIERTYRRPFVDRVLRATLAKVMPSPRLFRLSLLAARLAKPLAPLFAAAGLTPIAAMLRLAPANIPHPGPRGPRTFTAQGARRGRVSLLSGCVAPVLLPSVNDAAIRVLTRHGIEVVLPAGEGCCGSLVHHLGREPEALDQARANIDAWMHEIDGEGLDAILITASGCGTTVKDYGFMLRTDPQYAQKAAKVSALARDISEYLVTLDLALRLRAGALDRRSTMALCSLQHGQKITREPKDLLSKAGFVVKDVPEGHLCCGSAGTYNILQPEIARELRDRKVMNIEKIAPDVIAAGNIGCITQIAAGTELAVVHPVELVDWATGGPRPDAMKTKPVRSRIVAV